MNCLNRTYWDQYYINELKMKYYIFNLKFKKKLVEPKNGISF